jgi:hypothetical protein
MEHVRATVGPDAVIARLAATQHGVVALCQLHVAGLRIGAVNARVRKGRLHRLHRGVFAVGHTCVSREGRWLAAVLALGDGAVLSHVNAAALWGLRPSSSAMIHVTVPSSAGRQRRAGIVVHRSRTLRAQDIAERHAIAVTSPARTLLDLAGVIARGPLERAVERSLLLRLFDLNATWAVIDANPRRRGTATLTSVIEIMSAEPVLTRSELEVRMLDVCDAHNIVRPAVNVLVEGYEVDFLWRDQRLIVETDGHEHHGTRAAFERDRARDARLTMLGYRVVRFTYRQVVDEADSLAATLIAILCV